MGRAQREFRHRLAGGPAISVKRDFCQTSVSIRSLLGLPKPTTIWSHRTKWTWTKLGGTIGIEAEKPGKTKSYGTQELLNEGVDTLSSEQLLSKVRIYIMIIVRFSKSMSVYSLAAYHMILRNSKSPGTTFNHKSLPQSFFASWFLQMCTFWLWRLGGKNWRKRNGLFSWVPCSFVYT